MMIIKIEINFNPNCKNKQKRIPIYKFIARKNT